MTHADMGDDFPEIRKHMRAMNALAVPEPVALTPLEEVAKQLEIANLIGYATLLPTYSPTRVQLMERIEEGLRT